MRKIIFLCLLIFGTSLTQARDLDHEKALQMRLQGQILPAQQLLDQAFIKYPGSQLLEMKLKHKHKQNRYLYKLQMLTQAGQIRKLYFDAQSGELLQEKHKSYQD